MPKRVGVGKCHELCFIAFYSLQLY